MQFSRAVKLPADVMPKAKAKHLRDVAESRINQPSIWKFHLRYCDWHTFFVNGVHSYLRDLTGGLFVPFL